MKSVVIIAIVAVTMIGVMVPSGFAQPGLPGGLGGDSEWDRCTNYAKHLEDLDQCNREYTNRMMWDSTGPSIILLLFMIIFIILIILIIVIWKLRSKRKIK